MKTIWGEKLDVNNVLPEYPRPQMVRSSYINLNGVWEYAVTDDAVTDDEAAEKMPEKFDGNIVVPFSPECELSGVNRTVTPGQTLWYRRSFSLPESDGAGAGEHTDRVLLHFGAVDQIATVYVNGNEVCRHVGGYTAFSADVTLYLRGRGGIAGDNEEKGIRQESSGDEKDINELVVKVKDLSDTAPHSRGKQKTKRGGIWYTAQSGIWQTVWLEQVPAEYVGSLEITPLYDEAAVRIIVNLGQADTASRKCQAKIGDISVEFLTGEAAVIPLPGFIPWSPEAPHLYDIEITMGDDKVGSYFGMRKFSVEKDEKGVKRLFLNGKPYFHNGVLDQGYYSDGMLTAPSDEAMIFDIVTMKNMGFNMLRKHIKIEPMRWYYHCDRLGMLVWQDMMNGGGKYGMLTIASPLITGIHFRDSNYGRFGREDADGRQQYYLELEEMLNQLYNVPSIAMWVPFNEGWGQFDAEEAMKRILEKDRTRTVDHASGWHDQKAGEIQSLHVYYKKYKYKPDKLGRAVVLSEFGGYNCRIDGHCFNAKDFGYKKFESPEKLHAALHELYAGEIAPARENGLSAAVYTQLSDVEDELNGLVTYDRRVVKISTEREQIFI